MPKDLVLLVAEATGATQDTARTALAKMFAYIKEQGMANGITIKNFGSFKSKKISGREGVVAFSGQSYKTEDRFVLGFKASKN